MFASFAFRGSDFFPLVRMIPETPGKIRYKV
jgi:hypothetical protein